MEETQEVAYTTKEVSFTLDIGTSTLRKWCLALEENGYQFARSENTRRLFRERDIIALKYYKKLVQDERFSLGNASKVVVSRHEGKASESVTPAVLPDNEAEKRDLMRSNDEFRQQLLEYIIKQDEKQEKLHQEIMQRLDDQQAFFEKRVKEQEESFKKALEENTAPPQQEYREQPKEEQDTEPLDLVKYRLRIRRGQGAEKEEEESMKQPWVSDYAEVANEEESIKKAADPEEPEKKGFWMRLFGK